MAYEVTTPDGGGMTSIHVAYFADKAVASKFAIEKSTSSQWPYNVSEVVIDKTWVVLDSIDELNVMENMQKIQAALSKLTESEKKLLGLDGFNESKL